MTDHDPQQRAAADALLTAEAIRTRCERLYDLAERDQLEHLRLHTERLPDVAQTVADLTRATYPDLQVPYHSRWGHFDAADVPRVQQLFDAWTDVDPPERARREIDLAVTSVLLDAGAGPKWAYTDGDQRIARSEGLAVASLRMFLAGAFSSDPDQPHRADAQALEALTPQDLAQGFQVSDTNPLVGLEGRAQLLNNLGRALRLAPDTFGQDPPRVGHLFDALTAQANDTTIRARDILRALLLSLGPIWPGRLSLGGLPLGDVWRHPALTRPDAPPGHDLVPFHKLSQWLTYSLLEPFERAGYTVLDLDDLTGLPEYRNGGLFVDLGVLSPKHDAVTARPHTPNDPLVVEWRALTVSLLDRLAPLVRTHLGVSADAFPLAKVLQGGTWSAGRHAARERRPEGTPPIAILSDGTVF